jgi:hypothetical protein
MSTAWVCPKQPFGHDWAAGLECRHCGAARTAGEAILSALASVRGWSDEAAVAVRDAYRAEVLHQAADFVGNDDTCDCGGCDTCIPRKLADGLRAMAGGAAPALTVYRAQHDSIVMGLYTTREAARAHCEAEERLSWPTGTTLSFSWVPDDPDEDDSVEELSVVAGQNEESTTGYVVTPLEVASEYDEEATE